MLNRVATYYWEKKLYRACSAQLSSWFDMFAYVCPVTTKCSSTHARVPRRHHFLDSCGGPWSSEFEFTCKCGRGTGSRQGKHVFANRLCVQVQLPHVLLSKATGNALPQPGLRNCNAGSTHVVGLNESGPVPQLIPVQSA